ncbi:putative disease resistance protein RGA4 [Neltuma alba]|uniref:putative disease resistance protein RGA4 n=1 Tax=Neltuma alba TaxID=207710 RepID=UPI0010A4135D|nr:putative disease resistance protein RGA4 [Prosopis alba]
MDAIAGNVFQGLTSVALEEFKLLRNAKHDAESMKNTILAIRATLLDAEARANNNHQVSFWLKRLKDVLYDADDLLDDLSTEALRRGIMTRKVAKKVRIFFSKSNQVVYNFKMAHKLRELRGRLGEIDTDKKQFDFDDHPPKPLSLLEERKQTYSFVQEDEIIGREKEKDMILSYLLDNDAEASVSIIPIVGFGGLGKTTLAQIVYNHVDVQKHFGLQRWVCVSDEFDVKQIAQKILEQKSSKEMEEVQQDLRQLIEGKKFLIVLDNVWNDDVDLWRKLRSLLTMGEEGSMIIVTTRSGKVGKMMGNYPPIILEGLDGKRSWELFCRMAFEGDRESNDKKLLEIGNEVVKKCGGVPLAIRAVGRLVYDKILEGITDLSYLRNCELWKVDKLEERIFAILKLSYDNLPSPMKNCIAFCSLFPKDFVFKKQTLIQMWVAEGFIQSANQMRCEEDLGNEYFMNLLSRSFFQNIIRDEYGDIETCKMHDLIHDLAQFIAKDEYLLIKEEKAESTKDTIRHLAYDVPRENWEVPTSFLEFEKLRTMLLLTHSFSRQKDHPIFDLVASKLKLLRVLNLSNSCTTKIPKSIEKLKHLRFLDLSCNNIKQVPRTITKLHNLQTLNLACNSSIRELPEDISKLVSLRHLDLNFCDGLEWMPNGLRQLTSLQTLTDFVVDNKQMHEKRASARISELGELNNLKGRLTISGLKHLRSNPEEAESARLKEKQHLQCLSFYWDPIYSPFGEFSNDASDELILERLRPHHTIKRLHIRRFCGERLPDWIGNLVELRLLRLIDCRYLRSLPEGLRNLRSLKAMSIIGCPLLLADDVHVRQNFAHVPCVAIA